MDTRRVPGVEVRAGVPGRGLTRANVHTAELQTPVLGSAWSGEKHSKNKVAQLYGGDVLPGSRFDIQGGIGLMVSQWNTDVGWPYRAMQFKAVLRDTTKTVHPPDQINL